MCAIPKPAIWADQGLGRRVFPRLSHACSRPWGGALLLCRQPAQTQCAACPHADWMHGHERGNATCPCLAVVTRQWLAVQSVLQRPHCMDTAFIDNWPVYMDWANPPLRWDPTGCSNALYPGAVYPPQDRCDTLAALAGTSVQRWVVLDMYGYGGEWKSHPVPLGSCAPQNVAVACMSCRRSYLRRGIDVGLPPPTPAREAASSPYAADRDEVSRRCWGTRTSSRFRTAVTFVGSDRNTKRANFSRSQLVALDGVSVGSLGVMRILLRPHHQSIGKLLGSATKGSAESPFEVGLRTAHFGLAPRGDAYFSFRLVEVMASGLVPIIISDDWALPFEELIDWESVALLVGENALHTIAERLENLSLPTVCDMRLRAYDVYKRYLATPKQWARAIESIFEARGWHPDGAPILVAAVPNASSQALPTRRENSGAQCQCFSACSALDLRAFLARVPRWINASSSPWYAYLAAVYQTDVPLPFDLSKLRYIHHHGVHFNDIEWPMARCRHRHGKAHPILGVGIDPPMVALETPKCAQEACQRWATTSVDQSAAAALGLLSSKGDSPVGLHVELYADRTLRASRGTRWWTTDGASSSSDAEMGAASDGSWVEVMRWAKSYESMGGYGAWFARTSGSGIWLNVGRSWRAADKLELLGLPPHRPEGKRDLVGEWMQSLNLNLSERVAAREWRFAHQPKQAQLDAGLRSTVLHPALSVRMSNLGGTELFPYMANQIGLESVQIQSGPGGSTELVLTGDVHSNSRPACCRGCELKRRAHACSVSACTAASLRTGWAASLPCLCSQGVPTLNCDMSASLQSASRTPWTTTAHGHGLAGARTPPLR